jgi:hypothetical protein
LLAPLVVCTPGAGLLAATPPGPRQHEAELKQDRSARVIVGHAFVQNLRRGHYELAVDGPVSRRVAVAFDELTLAI